MTTQAKNLKVGDTIVRTSKLHVRVLTIEKITDKQIFYTVQRILPDVYPANGMPGFDYKSGLETNINLR